jgi:cell division protein FtsB
MSTRPRARTTRTLTAASDRLILGAAVPAARAPAPRGRRAPAETAAPMRRTVLGIRLPRLGPARRPRWPRVVLAVIAVYAVVLASSDIVRLVALNREIATVNAQIAQVHAHEAVLRMEAAALQSPADIADTAHKWLGLASPGDIVFTPVSSGAH